MQQHTMRNVFIGVILVLAVIYVYPTIGWMMKSPEERQQLIDKFEEEESTPHRPSLWGDIKQGFRHWASCHPDWGINLGLDLQGGVHMVVGLDKDDQNYTQAVEQYEEQGYSNDQIDQILQQQVLNRIERRIAEFEAKEPVIQALGSSQIQIQLPGEKDLTRATDLIMRNAFLGFHIVAGQEETQQVFADIEREFRDEFIQYVEPPMPGSPNFRVPAQYIGQVREVVEKARQVEGLIPEDKMIAFGREPKPWQEQYYDIYLLEKDPGATGEGLSGAFARPDQDSPAGNWVILFENDAAGAEQFGELTANNIGRNMAIVLDGVVMGAPTIRDRITASGEISGNFTQDEAQDLAISLNSGSLPVPIQEEQMGVVSATLGADSVRRGVTSALAGLVLVAAFMAVYYLAAGLIAVVTLAVNALLILALLAYFNATLTLPGIAGLILTIGMAVDANVLIFERMREEIRNGKSLLASIESGFDRAAVTILDANVTTLIAAIVLMQMGTGAVESFAITLSIGVCASVFTALIVSRAMFEFLAHRKLLQNVKMFSIIKPDTHIEFFKFRRYAYIASIVVVAGSLFWSGYKLSIGEMLGVEFTTGTSIIIHVNTPENIPVGDVRDKLVDSGFPRADVTRYDRADIDAPNSFYIQIADIGQDRSLEAIPAESPTQQDAGEEAASGTWSLFELPEAHAAAETGADEAPAAGGEAQETEAASAPEQMAGANPIAVRVQNALREMAQGMPLASGSTDMVELDSVETVGPAIGERMRADARQAIFSAILFIVLYLWFRFELRFALAAIAALIHDVSVTLGLFALTGREISLPVVAALLTIIGYSLNDTIIVFDRIRENMKLYRGRGMPLGELIDVSVNNTLSRTLLTSGTTMFVVLVLLFFGGSAINDFAFALTCGIIVGTYSSIYVASPLLYVLQGFQKRISVGFGLHADESKRGGKGGGRGKRRKPRKGTETGSGATA